MPHNDDAYALITTIKDLLDAFHFVGVHSDEVWRPARDSFPIEDASEGILTALADASPEVLMETVIHARRNVDHDIFDDHKRRRLLRVIEAYAIMSDNGKTDVSVKTIFGDQSLIDLANEKTNFKGIMKALDQGDQGAARTLIEKAGTIRRMHAEEMLQKIIASGATQVLPAFFDKVDANNSFATRFVQYRLADLFKPKASGTSSAALDETGLKALDLLIMMGKKSVDLTRFLPEVAQRNRPDLIPELIKRGANIRQALDHADNINYDSDHYPHYETAIKHIEDFLDQAGGLAPGTTAKSRSWGAIVARIAGSPPGGW